MDLTSQDRLGSRRFRISESSQRGEARRAAQACARNLGFDEGRSGRVAIVTSELAGNLLKHVPGGGQIILSPIQRSAELGIDVVAIDRGPGIAELAQALRDGYSSAGSAGTGLGAAARLSDAFDIFTSRDAGTVIVSRIWADRCPAVSPVTIGGICVALDGERVSGDAFAATERGGSVRILLADGLGHGPDAAVAARTAVAVFERSTAIPLTRVLEAMHQALRSTRGAAVAVAEFDPGRRTLEFAGIGNIGATIVAGGQTQNLASHNGTVGHAMRRIQQFSYPLPDRALTVLHSDGLKTHWTLHQYPGLLQRDPTVIAAVLLRDFERGRDDVTAVVARV